MIDISTLNEGQLESVTHGEGPLLVLAGAGSGKTRVLTYRVAHLIHSGEDPKSFLVTTFTKKAATEMTKRLELLIGARVKEVQIGTFHSFCLSVLKNELELTPEDMDNYILLEHQKKRIFKGLLDAPSRDYPDALNWNHDVGAAMAKIGLIKNELMNVQAYERQAEGNPLMKKMARLYRLYERYKGNRVDFDDMLLKCHELFKENPDILARYQEQFKWLLIDESQDNNLAQWELTRMLAHPRNNITVVGDDDQSIYNFRGARPDQILAFHEMFRGAKKIVLGENYRSTSNIVDMATKLIANNSIRYKKELKSMVGLGKDPIYIKAINPEGEASIICDEIEIMQKHGVKGGDIAILYRTNAQSRSFEDELVKRNIPYTIIGSKGFYARKEIKDIISYLNVINWPHNSQEDIERIINVPTRFLGKAFISAVKTYANKSGLNFFDAMTKTPGLKKFQEDKAELFCWHIGRLHNQIDDLSPAELIREIRQLFGYDKWLLKEEGAEDGADNNRIENLNELGIVASKFSNLTAFLDFVSRQQSKSNGKPDKNKVQLMTIHRSKGLEWNAVFLVGLSDGLLPHKNAIEYDDDNNIEPDSVEEERRLCYVGMTRARRDLYVSSVNSWQGNPLVPSMFIGEAGLVEDCALAVR